MTHIATYPAALAAMPRALAFKTGLLAVGGAAMLASSWALAVPAAAQAVAGTPPPASTGLTLEHRMLLKCSAAFALVAHGQSQGEAEMLGYKVAPTQAREYFVQAMAQVMDDTGFSREDVTEQLTQEAQRLSAGDGKGISEIMPACEVSLASFIPAASPAAVTPQGVP